jgi:hypothetical protein
MSLLSLQQPVNEPANVEMWFSSFVLSGFIATQWHPWTLLFLFISALSVLFAAIAMRNQFSNHQIVKQQAAHSARLSRIFKEQRALNAELEKEMLLDRVSRISKIPKATRKSRSTTTHA